MIVLLYIAVSLVLSLLLYVWWRKRPYDHIPGVTQLVAGSTPLSSLDTIYEQGIPKDGVMRVTACGVTRIFLSDADVIKDVALVRAKQFPKPPVYDVLNLWGENIVSTNDDIWKKHRVVADPAFAENHMNYLVRESAQSAQLLMDRLEKANNSRKIIDASTEMQDVTLDIIGKVAFGYDLGIFAPRTAEAPHSMTFEEALKITTTLGILVGGVLPTWMKPFFPHTVRALKETEGYMMELIKWRLSNLSENKFDLLSLLVSSNAEQIKETSLSDQELVSDIFIFLVAGHETSATSLNWLLYELALNPQIQQKMYDEVKQVLGDLSIQDMSVETYDKLQYVKHAVNETLRKHPPVSLVPKKARTDTKVGNFHVPKDTEIYFDVSHLHMMEKYWPDAKTFKPERFDPNSSEYHKVKACSFIPFSIGHRKCIGSKFSEIETAIIIAQFVLNYEFSLPKDDPRMNTSKVLSGDIDTEEVITRKPLHLKVEFKKRK
ncbi:cholesterol 24-hydroxylase [Acrasis kona]|uniref:Cholesterol 24-hydroxylase n=1 Tax=Acrasis kona TaxID=1008807 RepID=A0AAW2ZCL3_9EUKA